MQFCFGNHISNFFSYQSTPVRKKKLDFHFNVILKKKFDSLTILFFYSVDFLTFFKPKIDSSLPYTNSRCEFCQRDLKITIVHYPLKEKCELLASNNTFLLKNWHFWYFYDKLWIIKIENVHMTSLCYTWTTRVFILKCVNVYRLCQRLSLRICTNYAFKIFFTKCVVYRLWLKGQNCWRVELIYEFFFFFNRYFIFNKNEYQ